MSKKSRTRTRARAALTDKPTTTLREPADMVSVIPYFLGHEPHESVVIVSLVGPRRRFGPCLRHDLVDPAQAPELVSYLLSLVAHQRWDVVLCVGYSDNRGLADAVMRPLTERLLANGVGILESLGVGHGRWWSYTCSDPGCCPAEGTPFDPAASQAAAVMVAEGRSKAESREALRAQFAPALDSVRSAVAERCHALAAKRGAVGSSEWWTSAEVEEGVRNLLGKQDLDPDRCAELLTMVQSPLSRDVAWTMMTRSDADEHLRLWSQVVRAAPDALLPPAASLAGFAAWAAGNGVLASHAADRVSEVDPTHSMMLLLRRVLDNGVDPDCWDATAAKVRRVSSPV
jgi:hypothetical protein